MSLAAAALSRVDPSLRRLAGYLPPYKKTLAAALVFMGLAAAGSSLIALLLGQLTDLGFYGRAAWIVWAAPAALVFIAALHGGSMYMSQSLLGRVSQGVLETLREEMFERILRWPAGAYQETATGEVASRFANEANAALSGAAKNCVTLFRDSAQVVFLAAIILWHDWKLSLVCLAFAPVIVAVLRRINRRVRVAASQSQECTGQFLQNVHEALEARRVIKMSGAYEREARRFDAVNGSIARLSNRIALTSASAMPAAQLLAMAGVAAVLAIAIAEVNSGRTTLGSFVTFLAALLMILPPLRHLTGVNTAFAGIAAAAESIFRTMDRPQEKDEGTRELRVTAGLVRFEHVSFRYPGASEDALQDMTFEVRRGRPLALVGLSGSGKSTLASLLPRFWNPASGRILIDGTDLQDVTLSSLRRAIAVVPQDVRLFEGTIRSNLAYGLPPVPEERLWKALSEASLDEFVRSLPEGLDAPVGENGSRLSGGQRQRVAIARAFLKDAPILILDEATSALDAESERRIRAALPRLMRNRTAVIITHRMAAAREAAEAAVLERGRLREMGSPRELLGRDGLFSRLCREGLNGREEHE